MINNPIVVRTSDGEEGCTGGGHAVSGGGNVSIAGLEGGDPAAKETY